jgi:thiamine-phosphate pyrophosphorylase
VIVCYVTDRRRFDGSIRALLTHVGEAVRAGVDWIQIRERDLEARQLAEFVSDAVALTAGSRSRIIVNDRLDIALACGAGGVHLRSDSIGVSEARRLAPVGFLVGRSVHNLTELKPAAGADYLIAGSVFPTASKPGSRSLLGLTGLKAMALAASCPVLAIGGVTLDRISGIAAAGAQGVAAIALLSTPPLGPIVAEVRRQFDTAEWGP